MKDTLAEEIVETIKSKKFISWLESHMPLSTETHPWTEREILPEKNGGSTKTIEVMGMSCAGKSSGLDFLKTHPIADVRTFLQPELTYNDRPSDLRNVQGDFAKQFGLEYQIVVWNQMKTMASLEAYGNIIDFSKQIAIWKRSEQPPLIVLERGPNDILATNHTAALMSAPKEELPKWTKENWSHLQLSWDTSKYLHPDFSSLFLNTYLLGLTQAQFVNAVVLYDIPDFKTTRQRRVKRGDTPEGRFVTEKNFPLNVRGYDIWLNWVFPILRKRYGTGLLVLDGAQPLERNNVRLKNFCDAVCLN